MPPSVEANQLANGMYGTKVTHNFQPSSTRDCINEVRMQTKTKINSKLSQINVKKMQFIQRFKYEIIEGICLLLYFDFTCTNVCTQ